jgi:hypothetical protein
MSDGPTSNGDDDLGELSGKLAALATPDIDPARAEAIAAAGRRDVRRGKPRGRFVEPVIVIALVVTFLAWALWKTFG